MKHFFTLCLLVPCFAIAFPLVPAPDQTPGHRCDPSNPDFTEYRYEEKIPYCQRRVTTATKNKIYEKYKIPVAERKNYTIDHFIPLALGGSNAAQNLWPENKKIKALRPKLEMDLYIMISKGEITQLAAITIIEEAKLDPCHYTGLDAEPHGSDACDW